MSESEENSPASGHEGEDKAEPEKGRTADRTIPASEVAGALGWSALRRKPEGAAEPVGPGHQGEKKQHHNIYTLAVEAAMVGWSIARGLRKVETSAKTPAPVKSPAKPEEDEKTGRETDRNLSREHGASPERREKWGTVFIGFAFLVGAAGGIGFLVAYWTGGTNEWLGGTLALFFGGAGAALVLSTHWLMPHKQATEPREKLPSSPEEREKLLKDYCASAHEVRRRGMLKWMGAAGMGIFASMIVSLMRSLGMSPDPSLYSRVWKGGQQLMTVGGKPVTINTLEPGSSIMVFPEDSLGSEKTQTVLVRVKEELLDLPEGRTGWAPKGYLAYSRVCTHAGCPVGLYQAESHLLLCPCHQSTFDVLRGAPPTSGPAARPLPQLPLYVDSDGNLRAGGGFTAPPGPGFWGLHD